MASSLQRKVPATPQVISPSPTTSIPGRDGYFPLAAPHSTSKEDGRLQSPPYIDEEDADIACTSDLDGRARSRSRSLDPLRQRRMSGLSSPDSRVAGPRSGNAPITATKPTRRKPPESGTGNGHANEHLAPFDSVKNYWREISRSPSPLGLIPIHRRWRSFVHRHEIPRKALHVSIGFVTLGLYAYGYQTPSIHPVLLSLLIPIALLDILRHNWPPFNRAYIRACGAFMRETEAHDKYNGVIWYLVGTWAVMRFCPKDIGVVSILLLSWCDTAASTFGRLWGRYTPRIRRGKSLAGSLAASIVGIGTALLFWGWIAPSCEARGIVDDTGVNAFAFQGHLRLPGSTGPPAATGGLALAIMSFSAGLIASISEGVDVFGWDDNVTIPVLCGLGLWAFLKLFGQA